MSRFHGPQSGYKLNRGLNRKKGPKGSMKMYKVLKREEAEERQKAYKKLEKLALGAASDQMVD